MAVTTEYIVPITKRAIYSGLSTDTKPDSPAGSEFFETDTQDLYQYDGVQWSQLSSNGSAHVRAVGAGQLSRNRELIGLVTGVAQDAVWTAGEDVTELTLTLYSGIAGSAARDDGVFLVFNAETDLIRDTNMLAGSGQRDFLTVGTPQTFALIGGGKFTKLSALWAANNTVADLDLMIGAN